MSLYALCVALVAAWVALYIAWKRRSNFFDHDWKIGVFHLCLMAQCGVAASRAFEGDVGFSPIGIAAAVLYIWISRKTWVDGVPPHFRKS